jgi:hypothetical protein
MPYGPAPLKGTQDDGVDRGLVFVCFNASIEQQFEVIQGQWLQHGPAPDRDLGPDFLTSAASEAYLNGADDPPVKLRRDAPLVLTRGGEYFFMPGMSALRLLANERDALETWVDS